MSIITTGDDVAIPVQLYRKIAGVRSTFVIDMSATIKAVLTNLDRQTLVSAEVTLDNSATGADLATSLIVVEFTEAQSTAITELGECLIEIQVDDGGKDTWTVDALVRQGNIA